MMSKKDKTVENQTETLDNELVAEGIAAEGGAETATETNKEAALQTKVSELTSQVDELKDKFLRKSAEFDNFRRRMMKEKIENAKLANRDTLSALLPVLDDFDRAKKHAEDNDKADTFAEGVGLIQQKLNTLLRGKGLVAMESNGEGFDPDLHEALTEIPAPTEELKGKVVDTIEKGYYLNDVIIRHAKVVVGK
ncbi:MAG: nucleotide exchange factor GrpE [Saprospiraceae bacterium]